jgi:hypothetical protein
MPKMSRSAGANDVGVLVGVVVNVGGGMLPLDELLLLRGLLVAAFIAMKAHITAKEAIFRLST